MESKEQTPCPLYVLNESKFRKTVLPENDVWQILGVQPKPSDASHLDHKYLKIVAPMVRYSKLPLRLLCKKWGADLTFTPMIIAESFVRSSLARDSDFATSAEDRPVIAQFAAKDPIVRSIRLT